MNRLRQSVGNRTLMIGVDRLDYSKGLTARFQAYSHLLETHQETRGRTVLIQIAPPSRSEVPEYQDAFDIKDNAIALRRRAGSAIGSRQ
jgi:trehalose 6-phosphate synthase